MIFMLTVSTKTSLYYVLDIVEYVNKHNLKIIGEYNHVKNKIDCIYCEVIE